MTVDGPEDVMTQELKEATDALADNGGPQVTHMHLFGNVWRGEVHHHLQTHKVLTVKSNQEHFLHFHIKLI